MIREIIRMGHPTLRQLAIPYPDEKIGSEEFLELVEDMRDTLHASGGIGLAAPQIDIPYSLAVIEIINEESRYGDIPLAPFTVYINPTITALDETSAGYWEGCLSIPNIMGYVERPQHIKVDFTDESSQPQSLEVDGFLATVFQHEFDHLQGKLFIDRVNDTEKLAFDAEYRDFHLEQI
jgi:peptide deformylase